MAWTTTARGENDDHASSSNLVVASFTPNADTLMVAYIAGEDSSVSDITGHEGGGDWVQIGSVSYGSDWGELWACITGSSPSAGVVTLIKTAYTWNCTISVMEIGGADVSGTVANAFGTAVADANTGYDVRSHTVTLASFASATNMALAFCMNDGSDVFTFEGGYTKEAVGLVGTQDYSCVVGWNDGEDTTPSCTVANYASTAFFAVEVKEAAAAGGGAFPYHSIKKQRSTMRVLLTQ